jgi:hypothetical protein
MTLVELILALSITTMVGLAIASMMGVASAGVTTHQDARGLMLRAHLAQTRLLAYVAPSRCLLDAGDSSLVIWLRDARQGDTVHASEVRWVRLDGSNGRLVVHWVQFPEGMSEVTKGLEDGQLAVASDWWAVLQAYEVRGWTASATLVDGLTGVQVRTDQPRPLDSRHASLTLTFARAGGPMDVPISATIQQHAPPAGS